MKKSKVNSKELLEDLDSILNSIELLDNINLKTTDLKSISKELNKKSEKINKKYEEYLPKENLDSKK
tara:strand:+ start:229 stop:429 length:201 start_codon:yes stop_codon:yes gene_type:complete